MEVDGGVEKVPTAAAVPEKSANAAAAGGLRRGERKRRGPKPKPITVCMSRYRRREANARERQRQGEINKGFEDLRERIPHPVLSKGKCEKLRKIDVLHVAISYIRHASKIRRKTHIYIASYVKYLVK